MFMDVDFFGVCGFSGYCYDMFLVGMGSVDIY